MKKLLFFAAALFAAVSFSACSDDDDNNVNSNLLYGTWQEVHSSGYALENGQKVDEWDEVVREKSFYSFNSNGTGSYDNDAVEWDIRYTQSGNKLQMTCTDTQRDENVQLYVDDRVADGDGAGGHGVLQIDRGRRCL